MKIFLSVLLIFILIVSIILLESGCKEVAESSEEETVTNKTTEVETTTPKNAVKDKIAFVSNRD